MFAVNNTKRNKGETIVEVLLCIAILSSVMGFAFATASRSAKSVQANKERYQAILLANEQASLLKAKSNEASIRVDNAFCIKNDATFSVQTDSNASLYDAACKLRGIPSVYDVSIVDISTAPSTCNAVKGFCTYKIRVEWDSVKGARDSVEVFYAV